MTIARAEGRPGIGPIKGKFTRTELPPGTLDELRVYPSGSLLVTTPDSISVRRGIIVTVYEREAINAARIISPEMPLNPFAKTRAYSWEPSKPDHSGTTIPVERVPQRV